MASFKKTKSGIRLSEIMKNSYMNDYMKAQEGAFVVWIAVAVPAEIFLGFDNVVYAIPESHSAMTAAKGLGPKQCEKSEKLGYSMDLCSYARIDMGSVFDGGKDSPVGGLPKPHLLISNNNNCSLLVKWFDVYHRELGIPHFIVDIPFCYEGQKPEDQKYIVRQFHDLIRTIEEMSGQQYDMDRVQQGMKHTSEAHRHWKRFLKCAEHRPSGITVFDSFVQMAPFLTLRGTPELEDHIRLLADETEERLANKDFPVPDEKFRLLWDNIAPWHQLRNMQQQLAEKGANIVSASYTYNVGSLEGDYEYYGDKDEDPIEFCARLQNSTICPYGMHLRHKIMREAIKRNSIDGVVFASNRSCKPFSLMEIDQQRMVSEEFNIPTVMIDVDHADVRTYSEANVSLRMDALLEMIEAGRND